MIPLQAVEGPVACEFKSKTTIGSPCSNIPCTGERFSYTRCRDTRRIILFETPGPLDDYVPSRFSLTPKCHRVVEIPRRYRDVRNLRAKPYRYYQGRIQEGGGANGLHPPPKGWHLKV